MVTSQLQPAFGLLNPVTAMHTVPTLRRSKTGSRWLSLLLLSIVAVAHAFAQATGTVVGQVSNAATGTFLEGAEISAEGTGRSVTAGREGRFELSLPTGPAT